MREKGVRWIPMFKRQSYLVNGIQHFFGGMAVEAVGGGWGLVDFLFRSAERYGVAGALQHRPAQADPEPQGRDRPASPCSARTATRTSARKAVVLACGGFEADPEMRVRYYGPGWEMARVRGTRHNTGDGIKAALEIGAAAFGGWSTCHAVQWDLSAPPFGDRVVLDNYQKHSYPIGIIVNANGERFVDEGESFRNYTYAKYGREVMKQPQRMAVQIFDNKTNHLTRDEYRIRQVTKGQANTLEELATQLEISPEGLVRTVQEFNAACQPGEFNPAILDGKCTKGITPPKSNWAIPIDEPPYPRLRRDLRHHVQLRRAEDHHQRRGRGHDRPDHSRPVRGGRTGGRNLLPELPGRRGPGVRLGVRKAGRRFGGEIREGVSSVSDRVMARCADAIEQRGGQCHALSPPAGTP